MTQPEQRCGDVTEMMKVVVEGITKKNAVISLKRGDQTFFVLAISAFDASKSETKRGLYMPWRLIARQGQSLDYCLVGSGERVEALKSRHDESPQIRFGMPGSGYPRCSNGSDEEELSLYFWANKELGNSELYALHSVDGLDDFTFYGSLTDGNWILTNKPRAGVTCYFARGDDRVSRPDYVLNPGIGRPHD